MARSFNGTSDLIAVDGACINPIFNSAVFSVGGWVKGSAQNNKAIYAEGNSGNTAQWSILTETSAPNTHIRIINGATTVLTASSAAVFNNAWRHVLLSWNAGTWVLYVDGAQDSTNTIVMSSNPMDRATLAAIRRNSTGNWFAGSMAHWAIWDRALGAGDAASLAHGLLPSHLAPTHYWPIWGVDSPEPDIGTAAKASGTLTGTSSAASPPTSFYLLKTPLSLHGAAAVTVNKSDSDSASVASGVETAGPVTTKSDSDIATVTDTQYLIAAAISQSETESLAEGVPSIAISSSDSAFESSTQTAIAGGPSAFDSDVGTGTDSINALAVAVASSDALSFAEAPPAVSTPDHLAVNDSDSANLTSAATNSSGGIGNSFIGVVLAFDNSALDVSPTWTRLDDPNGKS